MARVWSHVSANNAAALLAREQQAEPQKHPARMHRPTYTSSDAFLAYRYLRVSARAIVSHTRFSDFFVIIFFFFFFFIFFFSHRPSALRKRWKRLIFTPNISTGDGGVHRHQAIVPILLYDTTTKSRGLQLHITERRHFTTATPFRVHAMWIYSADRTCCCQSPFPSLQLLAALTASFVSYGVVTLRISHNGFHCRTRFSHPFVWSCCLLLPLFYELDLSFSHLLVSLFCAYKLL